MKQKFPNFDLCGSIGLLGNPLNVTHSCFFKVITILLYIYIHHFCFIMLVLTNFVACHQFNEIC